MLAFAGGAILTMLAETMIPEAYLRGGKAVGLATTLGFGVAFAVSALDWANRRPAPEHDGGPLIGRR